MCAHTQEAGITGGSGCVLRFRKLESQEGLGVCSHTEAGITGGSECVFTHRKLESQGFWVCVHI